ncbi:hypothetical protein HJG60_008672 [Phyllostomus discolor]|uniref:Uncharacterized protein n=1 Tax=Phyllostomus discolor TaxID=89673 RepID=A0A833Z3V9_9CHIR|nr:hypothetical protein HJG60_008672 [Phyllostomus discolor]
MNSDWFWRCFWIAPLLRVTPPCRHPDPGLWPSRGEGHSHSVTMAEAHPGPNPVPKEQCARRLHFWSYVSVSGSSMFNPRSCVWKRWRNETHLEQQFFPLKHFTLFLPVIVNPTPHTPDSMLKLIFI